MVSMGLDEEVGVVMSGGLQVRDEGEAAKGKSQDSRNTSEVCARNYCGTERRAREAKGSRLMLTGDRAIWGGGSRRGLMPKLA